MQTPFRFYGLLFLSGFCLLSSLGSACRHETRRGAQAASVAPRAASGPGGVGGQTTGVDAEPAQQFGTSVQGRPMLAYVLGNGPNKTLIIGAVHGNERNTVGLVDLLHTYLKKHPEALEGCTVIISPCVNPDGWVLKSRRNAHGVDLNRNYPVGWKRIPPDSVYYSGAHPLSEPECSAVLNLIAEVHPQKIISVHGYAHMLLCEGERPHQIADAMQPFNHYRIKNSIGYATPGSLGMNCAATGDRQGLLTLELPHGTATQLWPRNRDALLAAIRLQIK